MVTIFTYAFGAEAASLDLPRKIACQNDGVAYTINDGENLADVMSRYYEYFANGAESDALRWVKYPDAATGDQLLACCAPAYDLAATFPTVVGAICMDLNIIASVNDMMTRPGFSAFWERIHDESRQCVRFDHNVLDLQRIRGDKQCTECDLTNQPCAPPVDDDRAQMIAAPSAAAIALAPLWW